MQANNENYFKDLELYAFDGQFFWVVETEALSSGICRDIISFDDMHLNHHG